MNMQFALTILLACLFELGEATTISKVLSLPQKSFWWPLGKYIFTTAPKIRAKLLSEVKAGVEGKIELTLYAYNAENWQKALKASNCTTRLKDQDGEYKLSVPLNTSWSDWFSLALPSKILYLVPADCYGLSYSNTSNLSTLFELDGGAEEAISDSELNQINSTAPSSVATSTPTKVNQTNPQQVSSKCS